MTDDTDMDKVFRQGMEAWERLKKEESWEDWLKVGHTHAAGREQAMRKAGTNQPQGRAYNTIFGKWLGEYKFDDMDKGDRSRLFAVMDNLPDIEAWRKTLTQTERLRLNHPSSVLRKWKKETQTPDEDKPKRKTQREVNIELDEENYGLKEHIKDIEGSREELKSENETLEARIKELSEENVQYLNRAIEAEARVKELEAKESEEAVKNLTATIDILEKANRNLDAAKAQADRIIRKWTNYLNNKSSDRNLSPSNLLKDLHDLMEEEVAERPKRAAS